MHPTLSQHCKEGLTFLVLAGRATWIQKFVVTFLLFQRKQPCTKNAANHLLITVCTFNHNNSRQHLAKWQVSSSPLRGVANFKNKFRTLRDAKIDVSVKIMIVVDWAMGYYHEHPIMVGGLIFKSWFFGLWTLPQSQSALLIWSMVVHSKRRGPLDVTVPQIVLWHWIPFKETRYSH